MADRYEERNRFNDRNRPRWYYEEEDYWEDRPAFRGTSRGYQGPWDADFEPTGYGEYNRDFNFDQSYERGNFERGSSGGDYSQGDYGRGYGRGYGRDFGQDYWGPNREYEGYGPRYPRSSDRNLGDFGPRQGMSRGRNFEGGERGSYGRSQYPRRARSDLRRGTIYDRSNRPNRGNYDLPSNWQDEFVHPRDLRTGEGFNPDYGRAWDEDFEEPEVWTYEEWWLVPGPYSGVGPAGYQRSDDRICEDVCERLSQHGQIDASDIEVNVDNGEVTLNGMVDSRRTKRMAEDVAESVSGVYDVNNQLRVRQQQQPRQQADQQPRSGEMGKAQAGGQMRSQIHAGMDVVSMDGKTIGQVKEVRNNEFLVDRPAARDVYVPFTACRSVSGDRVILNVAADDVDRQNWPAPDLLNTQGDQGR